MPSAPDDVRLCDRIAAGAGSPLGIGAARFRARDRSRSATGATIHVEGGNEAVRRGAFGR